MSASRGALSDSVVPLARGVAPEPGPCPLRRCAGPRRTKNTLQRSGQPPGGHPDAFESQQSLSMRGASRNLRCGAALWVVVRSAASLDGGIALSFESTRLALLRTILY